MKALVWVLRYGIVVFVIGSMMFSVATMQFF